MDFILVFSVDFFIFSFCYFFVLIFVLVYGVKGKSFYNLVVNSFFMSGISEEDWAKMSPEERLELQMQNCIFCKIIKGEIPSKKVYDDSNFVGILDKNPGSKGHVLLLPKKHVQIMPQLGAELCGELGVAAKKVSEKLKGALGVSSTSVFVANGAVAGQQAPHFMLHIIPRKSGDGINLNPESKSVDLKSVEALRNKFISALGLPVPGEVEEVEASENDVASSEVEVVDEVERDDLSNDVVNENDKVKGVDNSTVNDVEKIDNVTRDDNNNENDNSKNNNSDEISDDVKSDDGVDRALLDKISEMFD